MNTYLVLLALLSVGPICALTGLYRKIIPVHYVDHMPGSITGTSNGLRITVLRGAAWMPATIEHEYEHVRQDWMLSIVGHRILNRFRWYKLWAEARAYAVSAKHGRPLESCVQTYASVFGVSANDARARIRKYM